MLNLIPVLAPLLGDVIKRVIPDKDAAEKAESELRFALLEKQREIEATAASIIKAEASSSSWLASSWRPILMLTFGGLIVARWFGFAAPELSEAEYLALWDIVEVGIGGYVVSRGVEKVAPSIAKAIENSRK